VGMVIELEVILKPVGGLPQGDQLPWLMGCAKWTGQAAKPWVLRSTSWLLLSSLIRKKARNFFL